MKELISEVRSQMASSLWDKGVYLARSESVTQDSVEEEAYKLRVLDKATDVSYLVTLWVDDLDWECNCSGDDPCAHVAAAVIALSTAIRENKKLPSAQSGGSGLIGYAFSDKSGLLHLSRGIVDGDRWSSFSGSLQKNQGKLKFMADTYDWACDQILPPPWHGVFERLDLKRLFKVLKKVERVSLDGAPVRILEHAPRYEAHITDSGPGIKVEGRFRPQVLKVFKNGACLTTEGLAIYKAPDESDAYVRSLSKPKVYGPIEMPHFLGQVLPNLEKAAQIVNEAGNLPEETEVPVYIELDCQADGRNLVIKASLVYGKPALARIGGERLIPLKKTIPRRQLKKEEWLQAELERRFGLKLGVESVMPAQSAIELVGAAKVLDDIFTFHGKAHQDFNLYGELVPEVNFRDGRLDVSFTLSTQEQGEKTMRRADAKLAFEAFEKDELTIPLLDGGYASLPSDWMKAYGAKIMDLLASQEASEDGEVPRANLPELCGTLESMGQRPPETAVDLKSIMGSDDSIPQYELPQNFRATLRPYQQEGVNHLGMLKSLELGALLADDMGLGKTVQTIALLDGLSLVVAPTSVLPNWKKEIERFYPSMLVRLYYGKDRSSRSWHRLTGQQVVVLTSYAILRLDRELLEEVVWSNIVLDESHNIKNPSSQVAQAAFGLKGKFKLALTGTPIENRLDDLFSQFNFLHRGFLGGSKFFRERYTLPISKGDGHTAAYLKQRVAPFILRRRKEDVLHDLPEKTEMNLWVDLSEDERHLYNSLFLASQKEIAENLSGGRMMDALAALLRLRQAACHRGLIPGEVAEHSSKLNLLMERLSLVCEEGHKALVFSQWTSFLDLMEPALKRNHISYLRLDGTTKDRGELVNRFQSKDGPKVFIMSLKAGGVGLNLTAADHVFITDPWWNPAAERQAADRAHRIGQKKPVMIYRMLARDTIEEGIERLKQSKEALAESMITEGDGGPSTKDLLSLFES